MADGPSGQWKLWGIDFLATQLMGLKLYQSTQRISKDVMFYSYSWKHFGLRIQGKTSKGRP